MKKQSTIKQYNCTDTNGRKFSLMVDTEKHTVDAEWIAQQNIYRAENGYAAIVECFPAK